MKSKRLVSPGPIFQLKCFKVIASESDSRLSESDSESEASYNISYKLHSFYPQHLLWWNVASTTFTRETDEITISFTKIQRPLVFCNWHVYRHQFCPFRKFFIFFNTKTSNVLGDECVVKLYITKKSISITAQISSPNYSVSSCCTYPLPMKIENWGSVTTPICRVSISFRSFVSV